MRSGKNERKECVVSGFHRKVDENCTTLCYYAESSGDFLPTCWDNLYISVKNSFFLDS